MIASAPAGGSLLQAEAAPPGGLELRLPDAWTPRTEQLAVRTTIHLPHPTEAWFFENGASYQGPVDTFIAS